MAKRKYGTHSAAANKESARRGRSHDDNRASSMGDVRMAHMAEPLRHTASAAAREHYGEHGRESAERGGMKMAIRPNNRGGSFVVEDWNEPALLPRGVKEITVTGSTRNHKAGRLGDLYEQVEKTMREDQQAFDSITDPTNW